jgi:hypothetical protein
METEGMTRERLEAYRSNREEIKELKYKLDHMGEGDSLVGNDVIFDYKKGYPRAQAIVGYDYELGAKRRKRYKTQLAKLEAEQDGIEEWIFGIRDSRTRRIFQMYFLEGLTQEKVGRKMNMDRSVVSRKIEGFLKKQV